MGEPAAVTLDVFGTLVHFSIRRDELPLVADLLARAGSDADEHAVLTMWVRASLAERARLPFRTVRTALFVGADRSAREHGLAIDPQRPERRGVARADPENRATAALLLDRRGAGSEGNRVCLVGVDDPRAQ